MGVGSAAVRRRASCALALSAGILAVAAVPALAGGGVTYTGRSSQHKPVLLSLGKIKTKHGSQIGVTRFQITWLAHCKGFRQPLGPLTTFHTDVPLGTGGWNTFGSYSVAEGKNYIERFSVRDRGRISATKVAGVFRGRARILRRSDHHLLASCSSGTVHFTLRPKK